MPKRKTLPCPHCEALFSPQGFHGHVRMVHKLTPAEAREAAAKAAQLPEELVDDEQGEGRSLPVGLAVAGVGVLVLGVLLALRNPNVVACTRCGTKLDVSEARAEGAQVVTCANCRALVELP